VQPFPVLQWLQLINIPPSTIEDFSYLQKNLIRLEISNAGVNELSHLFGSPTLQTCQRLKTFRQHYLVNSETFEAAANTSDTPQCHASSSTCAKSSPISYVLPLEEFMEAKGNTQINLLWANLLFLRMNNCGLTHLDSSLYLLPFVKQLDFSHNTISKFKYLKGCLNLRIANLSSNKFQSLVNIGSGLSNIQRLNLSHNTIKSLQGLEKLIFLEKLDLSFNVITNMDEVEHLVKLKYLEAIILTGNPMATLYANTESCGSQSSHRHPMWETFLKQQQRIWQSTSQRSHYLRQQEEDNRFFRSGESLYRIMAFAYFFPELSSNGHYRTREMVILDGQEMSEMENEIIK
jgi:Leucine-rich repeat (LRR) protein